MNLDDADERSALAGEYVLGTLDPAAHAAFEAALAGDAGLRAEVGAWQDRLLGLVRQTEPSEPSASLWARIDASLPAPRAAADPRPASSRAGAAAPPWWQRLGVWQGISAAALAAVLVLSTLLLLRSPALEPAQYLALLQAPDTASTGWIVEARSGGDLKLVPVADGVAAPAGRSLQFWTKPDGAAAPTSLGLVQAGAALTLPVSRLPGLGERQLFEITLEPEGGSTVGRPTGPVLFIGRMLRL